MTWTPALYEMKWALQNLHDAKRRARRRLGPPYRIDQQTRLRKRNEQ